MQSFAKQTVMDEVEKRSEKNTCRAEVIFSDIVSDLTKEGLDDYAVLFTATQENVHVFSLLLKNAKHAINKALKDLLSIFGMRDY